ncbi:MAG: hypothetical protein ABH851_05660 [Methanobacteriota archaeon]
MWIMTKTIKGREYLYLYKSVWERGRPRNKFVRYLGPAVKYTDREIKKIIEDEKAREKD